MENHPIERYAIRSLFLKHDDIQVVGEGINGMEAIELARNRSLDVMLLDISMPGLSGLDSMVRIHARRPDLNVLILSGFSEEIYALKMIERGAAGYLNKLSDPGEIIEAVRHVATGKKFITSSVSQLLTSSLLINDATSQRHNALSKREFQVLLQLARGAKLKSVAEDLSITPKTVAAHRAQVFIKMQMKTKADLTHYAVKNGLVR